MAKCNLDVTYPVGKVSTEIRLGLHAGYCVKCSCMVGDFDKLRCPRCLHKHRDGELVKERPEAAKDKHLEVIRKARFVNYGDLVNSGKIPEVRYGNSSIK